MLWSTSMCFLKSLWSSTFNDLHHMIFFAIHKQSCYGQCECAFSSRSDLQLWMTFITWSFSLFIKNHVLVNVNVFSQIVVIFNCEWHSSLEVFRYSKKIMLWSTCMCFLKSLWSSTLNDIHHLKFFANNKQSCYG